MFAGTSEPDSAERSRSEKAGPVGRSSSLASTTPCLAFIGFVLAGCSLSGERVAPYHGRVVSRDTSTVEDKDDSVTTVDVTVDTTVVDLSELPGLIVFDREMDGLLNDTSVFYGDESGEFEGVLRYENPLLLRAQWVRKPVHLMIQEIGLDTYLYVDAYNTGNTDSETEMITLWDALLVSGVQAPMPASGK